MRARLAAALSRHPIDRSSIVLLTAIFLFSGRPARAVECNWAYDPAIGQPGLQSPGSGSMARAFEPLGGDLVVAGYFFEAGGLPAQHVALWNGTQLAPMGAGFSSSVNALATFQGSVHAFGQFLFAWPATAWRAARWDGSAWQPLGPDHGLQRPSALQSGEAMAALVRGDSIIVGGGFTRAGDSPVGLVAAWDGADWHPLGAGFDTLSSDSGTCQWADNPAVFALTEYNGEIIAGGSFRVTAGGDTVHCIARWDGTSWHPLGTGMGRIATDCLPPWVYALTVWNGDLIAGGGFRTAGGQSIARVARWDGTSWHAMGSQWTTSRGGEVWELEVSSNGELFAAGWLQQPGTTVNKWQVSRWNGSSWEQVGPDLTWISAPAVSELLAWGDDLVVGGSFTGHTEGETMNYVTMLRCNATTAVGGAMASSAAGLRATSSNPFIGAIQLSYGLANAGDDVALEVHDLAGRRVRTLRTGPGAAGQHRAEWNGRGDDGARVPPGVYFVRLRADEEVRSLRIVKL